MKEHPYGDSIGKAACQGPEDYGENRLDELF
jgi:hypothetical protein